MKFKKITDAHKNFGQVVRLIEEEHEDVILVRNGKPCLLIQWMDEDDLEDYILAKHLEVDKLAKQVHTDTITQEELEKELGLSD